jgi:predicted CXXCH cytochrome family protein
MAKRRKQPVKKNKPGIKIPWKPVVIVLLFGFFIAAGGFTFAATKESHDPFCGSCHTQPESTYLERSTASKEVDLASYHTQTTPSTRCIDCHSGQGLFGRMQAELLGARNALKWYSGTATQPAPLTQPIKDINCLKCHQQITETGYKPKNQNFAGNSEIQNGHWHLFLKRWQGMETRAGTCVSCHTGHNTNGDASIFFLNKLDTEAVCGSCHQKLGGGD